MKPSAIHTCKKWSTVFGSFLVSLPLGLPRYWGNMSVYVLSYFCRQQSFTENLDAPFVIPLFVSGMCIGSFVAGFGMLYIGKRLTLIISMIVFSAGWLMAYFTLGTSLLAMSLVLGLVISISKSAIQGIVMQFCVEWSREDVGFLSSLPLTGISIGAVIINEFITEYVNPKNLSPDQQEGQSIFFSQNDILDKVPSLFYILAISSFIINVIGLILIMDNQEQTGERKKPVSSPDYNSTTATVNQTVCNFPLSENSHRAELSSATTDNDRKAVNIHPRAVIRSYDLYKIWFLVIASEPSFVLLNNYYKSYGHLYVHNDHFLTSLSTMILLGNAVFRGLWGWIFDHWGAKVSFILTFCGSFFGSFLMYFSPMTGSKWFYMAAVLFLATVGSHNFVLVISSLVKLYGKKYFLFNLGLALAPTVVINPILPYIFQLSLSSFGWFGVTMVSAVSSFLGLVVSIIMLQDL